VAFGIHPKTPNKNGKVPGLFVALAT